MTEYLPNFSPGAGYWVSPKGEAIQIVTHIDAVTRHPEKFGYTKEDLEAVYARYGEPFGSERNARQEIIWVLVLKGWIRIRHYPKGFGQGYTVNVREDNNTTYQLVGQFFSALIQRNPEMDSYENIRLDAPTGVRIVTVKQAVDDAHRQSEAGYSVPFRFVQGVGRLDIQDGEPFSRA